MSQAGIASDSTSPAADIESITGNSGIVVVPDASYNVNIVGSGNITTVGTLNTLTIQNNQFLLATNYTSIAFSDSPYTVLSTDYFISLNTSGGAITVLLPNAPTTKRIIIIKDRTGNAAANNVTVTTVGGVVLIDGAASVTMNQNHGDLQVLFNGTSYEVF